MRILCLDVGDRKIGVSLSDPTFSIAQGLTLYRRNSPKEDLKQLRKMVQDNEVNRIVIGLPRNLDGSIGKRAQEIIDFAEEIEKQLGTPVVLWDERFSTNEAHRVFELAHITHKKRRPFIDIMAAQLILQGYLDAQQTR
jgi:putative holliday junction resolvase